MNPLMPPRRPGRSRVSWLCAGLLFGAACAPDGPGARTDTLPGIGAAEMLESPAGPNSGEPFLSAAGERVLLSWLEATADSAVELRFAAFDGSSWTPARPITRRRDFFVNWADFPSILMLPDGRLATHWLQREGPATYAYGVRIATSTDDGATWSDPVTPHTDGTLTEHGFVSLFPATGGGLGAVWLDGRRMVADEGGHGGGDMTLRSARILPDGTLADEAEIDARTCECCQTSVAVTAAGPIAAYRDRSDAEIRNMAISRLLEDGWTEPTPVHNDGWEIAGCPVNGPAAAADGAMLAVAWFTAPGDVPRVNIAFSADAGASFNAPIRVDGGDPVGRVDVLMLDAGVALVSWLERTAEGAVVRARRVAADGRVGPPRDIATSSAERPSGFPRMVRQSQHVIFAWTDPARPARVQVARVPLSEES
jgi:hypothetical protein